MLMLSLSFCAAAQNNERLTVFIAVEGLNDFAVNRIWENSNAHALKFPHKVFGGTESLATLMSGTLPRTHGIAHDLYFDGEKHRLLPILSRKGIASIGADDILTPENITAPTLPDMLKINNKFSKIYAVALNPKFAITLAGHNANAAIWLNAKTMRWAASQYYREGLPAAADKMNVAKEIETRAQQIWRPSLDSVQLYHYLSDKERVEHGFAYYAAGKDKNGSQFFVNTPFANQLVLDLALELQDEHKLGIYTDDMLLLQLTTNTPASMSDRVQSAEQEDMYLSLWKQITDFSDTLSARVNNNVNIIITGIPSRGESAVTLEKHHLACGEFNIERAAALVNTYLMAIYGHHSWIIGTNANALIVNKSILSEQKINYNDFTLQVAQFLENFEGVNKAYTVQQINAACNDNTELTQIRNSISKLYDGDVFVTLTKGWRLSSNSQTLDTYHSGVATAPTIIITNGQAIDYDATSAVELLPNICKILKIDYIK